MEARMKNEGLKTSWVIFLKRCINSVFLICCIAWLQIIYSTAHGQLPREKRIIPVTNIVELFEYVLLPHNDDVTKPCALNTFLDGLAEFLSLSTSSPGRFSLAWRWGGKRPWHRSVTWPPNTQNLWVYWISIRSHTINKTSKMAGRSEFLSVLRRVGFSLSNENFPSLNFKSL